MVFITAVCILFLIGFCVSLPAAVFVKYFVTVFPDKITVGTEKLKRARHIKQIRTKKAMIKKSAHVRAVA